MKMVCHREGAMELRMHENAVFLSSCQYSHAVAQQLSWPHYRNFNYTHISLQSIQLKTI